MGDKHNVFLSWSGPRSKWAAAALRDWLPLVLQSAKPWMSEEDIDKGSRGLDEVGRALEGMRIGIICLTPENLLAPWILFESGALSKTLDAGTRVCTYLLAGLRPQDVERPLGMFQATASNKEDTKRLVHAINKALEGEPVPEGNLDAVFEGMWPRLEERLSKMPATSSAVPSKRPTDEMVAEILELSRAAATSRSKTERMEQYLPIFDELMPMIADQLKAARNAQAHAKTLPTTLRPGVGKTLCIKIKGDDQINKFVDALEFIKVGADSIVMVRYGQRPVTVDNVEDCWWDETQSLGASTP